MPTLKSIKDSETDIFCEPGLFVIKKDQINTNSIYLLNVRILLSSLILMDHVKITAMITHPTVPPSLYTDKRRVNEGELLGRCAVEQGNGYYYNEVPIS